MVLRISHIKVSGRVQSHTPRVAELPRFSARTANDLNRAIVCIKDLNTAIPKFADILASRVVDANIIRITQLASTGAGFAVSAEKLTVAGENLNAMVTGIGDIKSVL